MEYFCVEILDLASTQTFLRNGTSVTPRDLFMGIQTDKELKIFFDKNSFIILGQGLAPEHMDAGNLIQQGGDILLPKHPFSEIVRELVTRIEQSPTKVSKSCFITLQYYIEQRIVELLRKSNKICQHANRSKVTPEDIQFAYDNLL